MVLLNRSEVLSQFRQSIDNNNFACEATTCQCFKKLEEGMRFAILSHRWGDDELTFQDFSEATKRRGGISSMTLKRIMEQSTGETGEDSVLKRMQEADSKLPANCGFAKLVKLCEIAAKQSCPFVWLDTICINKESSADLEESIRSMFNWYRGSHVCIAHLAQTEDCIDMLNEPWFTRGWTLQELLAPRRIQFFTKRWERITGRFNDKDVGDQRREKPPLMATISRITNISIDDLINFEPGLHNIRQRMSWASRRKTTRVEDMAYGLIGIFGLSLSVAYGEGNNAFYRLQVEIMQRTNDRGLFDWDGKASAHSSMLAEGPQCFGPMPRMVELYHLPTPYTNPTYKMTNFGLHLRLVVYPPNDPELKRALALPMSTAYQHAQIALLARAGETEYRAIVLKKDNNQEERWVRVKLITLSFRNTPPTRSPIKLFIK